MVKKSPYLFSFVFILAVAAGVFAIDYSPYISDEFVLHWPDPTRAYPNIPLDFRFVAYEIHNSPLTWELFNEPAGMTIDQDGNVDWTPTTGDIGIYNITVRVTRDASGYIERAFALNVNTTDFIFVATTGSDTTGNGTLVLPYGTIEHAMRQITNGNGKTIYIRDGTYHEAYAWEAGGIISPLRAKDFSPADPVEIRSYPAESAILDCDLSGHGLWAYSTSYVIFSNLEVREASNRGGGLFAGGSQHVMIRDSVVRECHWNYSNNCTGYMAQGSDDVVFDRCEGYNNRDLASSHWNSSNYLVYTESGTSTNIYIQNCISADSVTGFKIKHAGPRRLIVHNCISIGDGIAYAGASDFTSYRYSVALGSGTGIQLGLTDPNPYTHGAMLVEHMTIANATRAALRIQDSYCDSGSIIQNNILYNDIEPATSSSDPYDRLYSIWNYQPSGPALTSDKNLFYSPSQNNIVRYGPTNYSFLTWQGAGYDGSSVFGDPLFIDPAVGDMSVPLASPADLGGGEFAGAYVPGTINLLIPGQAIDPGPADSAVNVNTDEVLSWTAGFLAKSHDVYLGTSLSDVNNAARLTGDIDGSGVADWNDIQILGQQWLTDPAGLYPSADLDGSNNANFGDLAIIADNWRQQADPVFKGNQTETTYDPGTLINEMTYYWRIDEVNAKGTTTGKIWSFTVLTASLPGQATNPSPADSDGDVAVDADLSWTGDPDATSHDVYFGTTSPGDFQGNQTETTFDPGALAYNTTCYWRIDEVNANGTTTGIVWNFTTGAVPPAFVQDSDANGIVSIEAENYAANTPQGGHDWISVTTPAGYSGTSAMNTTPNINTSINTGYAADSPRLDFIVYFTKTGTHYIWIRGYGDGGSGDSDDSCHAGLDGAEISTSDRISTFPPAYTWSKATMDGPDATINVTSTGLHTVNVWMREDGFVFDKMVLTTNPAYTPTGNGPDESPYNKMLDGFELYNATSNPFKDKWLPTGATEQYYFLKDLFVHTGNWAMLIWADNSFPPYYCGAERTDLPQDYTIGGVAAGLSLWFRGGATIDEIYVKLTDSADAWAVVKYSDAWDIGDLEVEDWQQWNIDLMHFTTYNPSFDMTAVKALEIGVGDCLNPRPVGAGTVYFDDILLYR